MNNQDDILQQSLNALERGSDVEEVLVSLPEGDPELAPLIQLAAAVRRMPHPEPLRVRSQARKRALLNAASEATRPVPQFTPRERLSPNGHGSQQIKPRPAFHLFFSAVGVGVLAIFMMAFVGMLGLGLWIFAAPHNAQSATLMDLQGQVEVASPGSASWRTVANGDKVSSGERIRTGVASQATLVFFEGSRTVVGSNAELALTRIDGDWGRVLRVVLNQYAGKTSHSVVPLRGKSSQFMVFTPAGAGSVHGTNFNVAVGVQGASRFAVDTGRVLVSNHSSQVFLAAGQAVTLSADAALDDPAFQFVLQGTLTAWNETGGAIEGTPFIVTEETQVTGTPEVGQTARVEGRVVENGDWVADFVEPLEEGEFTGSFTGILEVMGGDEWQVSGKLVAVTDETDVAAGLNVGSSVRVTFRILEDGSWLALQIEGLDEEAGDAEETPTATPDPDANPVLVFDPDTLEGATCGEDFTQTGYLVNNGAEEGDYAADVELGYALVQGAEFVDWVTLNPSGWESIAAGDQAVFEIHVNLDEASWGAAPEGTQVEVRVFVAAERNQPDNPVSNLTITITASCDSDEEPAETETVTETEAATETATATPEPPESTQPAPEAGGYCTGANPHPKGQELAGRYGVSYEEIMGWFCQGFGFGEIDLAYGLSRTYDVPVEDVFARRSSGMGWGNIRKALAADQLASPETTPEPVETVEPAETTEPVETAEPTETVEPTETAEPVAGEGGYCTGVNPHPTGQSLAWQYGVPYEEIMGWFCQGFGFGEIDLAYSLGRTYNKSVGEIFAMRLSGMGWGQIRKALNNGSGNNNGNPATLSPGSGDPGNGGDNPGSTNPGNENGNKNDGRGKNKGK